VEVRNREQLEPFTTKDGSMIREFLHTAQQSLAEAELGPGQSTQRHYHERSERFLCCCAPPYSHDDTFE